MSNNTHNHTSEDNPTPPVLKHTIEAALHTWDPDALLRLRDHTYLIETFRCRDQILYQWQDWVVTLKDWPSSVQDLMIIYSWKDTHANSLALLDKTVIWELGAIYNKVIVTMEGLRSQWWKYALISWINQVFYPWAGKAQSVFRPHIHCTLIQETVGKYGTHEITEVAKDEVEKALSLSPENQELMNYIANILKENNFTIAKWPLAWYDSQVVDIDISGQDIISAYHAISTIIRNSMGRDIFSPIFGDLIGNNRISIADTWVKVQKLLQLWFTLSIRHDPNTDQVKIRVRSTQKTPWGWIWLLESWQIVLNRLRVAQPKLLDQTEFKAHMRKALWYSPN